MLEKGAACAQCRKRKAKCDAMKPQCSRCSRLQRDCDYSPPYQVADRSWPPAMEALEARVLELELLILKSTLPATHNLALLTKKLLARIELLGTVPRPRRLPDTGNSAQLLLSPCPGGIKSQVRDKRGVMQDGLPTGDPREIQKAVEQELNCYNLAELEELSELPHSLSINLISLFLPYYTHFFFLIDIPDFISRVSLPPTHPDSIHPCLLNACYLAACAGNGDGLTSFKSYFLRRTRRFLQQSLMFVDRTTHFLRAKLILGTFFAQERRVVECLTVIGTTACFAAACGLNLPYDSMKGWENSYPDGYLLPPPKDKAEADDRIRLAHSIYTGCQFLYLVCGYGHAITQDDGSSLLMNATRLEDQDPKVRSTLPYIIINS
ncbi:hypothetical protein DL93DRAFT_1478092 [Clavulina sp. PMI_390]|nr:hypothetical protein DL93DRAFT_1478092 [Clavulina sp. PMI_390]